MVCILPNIHARGKTMNKILIVEDEEFLRMLYTDAFHSKGYTTESAENGQKGLDVVREFRPDLVILDLRMPVMDGYQFLQEIKNDPGLKRIPVILLTSSPEIRDIGKCLSQGAIGYLDKSGSPSDVVKKVETVFRTFVSSIVSSSTGSGRDSRLRNTY